MRHEDNSWYIKLNGSYAEYCCGMRFNDYMDSPCFKIFLSQAAGVPGVGVGVGGGNVGVVSGQGSPLPSSTCTLTVVR